ncbi:MAG: hypothetical protein KJ792_13595 [Actinobacteria bacterium]|nr:hypothetical protein [Actinomycetota bacterium]MCG2803235.1 hypothetical protein [Cellulomonas sp.]
MTAPIPTLPAPAAVRLRRPGWRDPRLGVGLSIVAASVAVGSWVVRSAAQTVGVYAAASTLVPGDQVAAGDLAIVQVRGVDTARYLSAEEPLPDGAVLLRSVGRGELVPASAIGGPAAVDVRSVAVPLGGRPADSVPVGSLVDLWFTATADTSSDPVAPKALVSGVEVARVDGAGSYGSTPGVEVLVPREALAPVLAALASDGSVEVVPVPGTGR